MSDALKLVTHIIIVVSLVAAIIISFQENYARAAYIMSVAIYLELVVSD